MFLIIFLLSQLYGHSLFSKRSDEESLLRNQELTKTTDLVYEILTEGQYNWYVGMRNKLYKFLTQNGLESYTEFEKNILNYIVSHKDEDLDSLTKREFIKIFDLFIANFSIVRACYCKRKKPIHPDLKNILRIFELLYGTKIFRKNSKEVCDTGVFNINCVLAGIWTFFRNHFENQEFYKNLECLYRSILLEIFQCYFGVLRSYDDLTNENLTYALRDYFPSEKNKDLKIKYVDETGDTPLTRVFEYSADRIQIGNFFSSSEEDTQKQPNIIIKHMNTDRSFNFHDKFEFDEKIYNVASFAFDDSSLKKSERSVFVYDRIFKIFRNCSTNPLTIPDFLRRRNKGRTMYVCFEEESRSLCRRTCQPRIFRMYGWY